MPLYQTAPAQNLTWKSQQAPLKCRENLQAILSEEMIFKSGMMYGENATFHFI
jgi:hypothetical protein